MLTNDELNFYYYKYFDNCIYHAERSSINGEFNSGVLVGFSGRVVAENVAFASVGEFNKLNLNSIQQPGICFFRINGEKAQVLKLVIE